MNIAAFASWSDIATHNTVRKLKRKKRAQSEAAIMLARIAKEHAYKIMGR